MRKTNVIMMLLAFVVLGTTMMYAQASRTWVSGVGDDANPCSRTAPCKTFAGAISKTAPGGEIDALDPGGFGALTITKAITIDGGGGQVASVLVAGTNGITVFAQPGDVVILRNLRINGIRGSGNGGINGINFIQGGELDIETVTVFGFNNDCIHIALPASATVHIINSVTKNCGVDGVSATTTAGNLVKVGIRNSAFMVSGQNGVHASSNSRISVDHGFISAFVGAGVLSDGTGGTSIASVDYSDVIDGNNGLTTANGSSIVVAHTTIANNVGTAYNNSGATIFAFATGAAVSTSGTNRVHDNGAQGTATYITEN